jgi:TorA maturation chaperone TorD
MSATVTPLHFQPPDVPEDKARAGYYALLARLFYSGPDAQLLMAIGNADGMAAADGAPSAIGEAWSGLAAAARVMDPEAARLEYDELFVGTGKAEVTPYASYYLAQTGREKILARLRGELAGLGLSRGTDAHEPEDHFAGLLDVMRHLILLGSDDAALQKQQAFFARYMDASCKAFCSAIAASQKSNFYKHVAQFASAFFVVEAEALKVF